MSLSRQKRLERAQMKVLFTVPFFAPGVAKLNVVFDDAVETACTDGVEIRWGTKFFDGLSDAQLVTVLCHEVSHAMLGHLWRAPGGCDWELWNQATDHAVNLMLKEFSEGVMAQRLADPFPFPEPAEAYCADPAFKGLAEEVIYNRLASSKQSGGSGGSNGSGGSGKVAPGASRGANSNPKPGSMPAFGQMAQPQAPGPVAPGASGKPAPSSKQLQNDWTATLMQAAQIAKGRGELPAGLERLVGELVNPKVDWWEVLRNWLREQCSDDWDWQQPDMTMSGSGFILPSLKSEKMGPVVFATDTSGSIDKDMLAQFQSEKQNCLDEMKPSRLVDIYCDSKIHKVAEYCRGEDIVKQCPGGGGTAFEPVFAHVSKMAEAPKCLVYLTDGDGSLGEYKSVDYPVLWVLYGTNKPMPFGESIFEK